MQLADGELVGVTAYGEWAAVKELYSRVFENKGISEAELKYFEQCGELIQLEKEAAGEEDESKVICTCVYVTKGEIAACIKKGCTRVSEISEKLGAGTVCGGCVPTLQEMLGRESWQAMHIYKKYQLTPDVRAYRFILLNNKPLRPFHSGQHVVIQCEINGDWIERSYTLTSAPHNSEYYEIAVKREDKGLLSRWLFDNDQCVPFLRVSNPMGHFFLDLTKSCSIICFTAGIGITPAVSFARAISEINSSRPLFIYTSAHSNEHLPYDAEIEALAKKHPQIKYFKHLSVDKGRMQSEDIKIARQDPNADFFICGPKGFESMVKSALQSAGIKDNQIMIEKFTNAYGP